jgi:hypothetical protein
MFENYKLLSAEEKTKIKAIHKAVRAEVHSRAGGLAWAYLRGFPYRRVERTTRTQVMPDGKVVNHNLPDIRAVARILVAAMPELGPTWLKSGGMLLLETCPLIAWVKDPSGAISAPPPPVKVPYQAAVSVA